VREGHDFQFFFSCCPEIKGEKATLYGYTVHVVLSILSQLLPSSSISPTASSKWTFNSFSVAAQRSSPPPSSARASSSSAPLSILSQLLPGGYLSAIGDTIDLGARQLSILSQLLPRFWQAGSL